MPKGVVIKAMSNYVQVAVDRHIYLCTLRGRMRKEKHSVMTGDYVQITVTDDETGVVETILPRRNELTRPPVANVDQVFVVLAVTRPSPNSNLLDRMLVIVEEKGLDAVICFSKFDLLKTLPSEEQEQIEQLVNIYEEIGYPVLRTNTKDPESTAVIREMCQNKVSVLAGPSGVGKSSLLNAMHPTLDLPTGAVSSKSGQGRHTTRHMNLLRVGENGFMADSPGFSVLEFPEIEPRDLGFFYPEMVPWIPHCKFTSCVHHKEPGCAVKNQVSNGGISLERYSNYLLFLEEIMNRERRY